MSVRTCGRPLPDRRPARAGLLAAAIALLLAAGSAVLTVRGQEPQRPPTFRTGANVIRVDATVTDRSGNPLTTLTADDFEIREDGKLQTISSFKFISVDGQPADDRSLPIRSQTHAATEAAREDVRTFLVFWDEYHIHPFSSALRGRQALTQALLEAFGPTDLVAVMDQLTPISAIEFTRDRRALADQAHNLKGRMGEYFPPRSAVEEAHLKVMRNYGDLEAFRTQVSVSAIKSAAAHLGTLGPGRKTLIVVTQALVGAPGGGRIGMVPVGLQRPMGFTDRDMQSMAIDIVRAANDSNTAVHVIDPRGLQVNSPLFGGTLDMIASGTGGQLHKTNDAVEAFKRMVKEVSALYLLGYMREMPTDGLFHQIRVRVKRSGTDVRARAGYWAPRLEDIETARKKAAAAVLPPSVADAFAALTPSTAPRLIDLWSGTRLLPDGRAQLTLAWSPRHGISDNAIPAFVTVAGRAAGAELFEQRVEPEGTMVDVPAATIQLAIRVMSKDGEILDRESRTIELNRQEAAPLWFDTPVVYRSRTPSELRTITGSATPLVHAGRAFVRTDRLTVRTHVRGTLAAANVTAKLIDRRGAVLVQLPVQRIRDDGHQLDLPLTSLAAGEFAIVFEAASGEARAEALVSFRVLR